MNFILCMKMHMLYNGLVREVEQETQYGK